MKRLIMLLALAGLGGCAISGQALVQNLSSCDLPDAAICAWELKAEEGANRAIDYADSRLCLDLVTKCPDGNGGLRAVPCAPQTCQSEPGVGDRFRRTVDVVPE